MTLPCAGSWVSFLGGCLVTLVVGERGRGRLKPRGSDEELLGVQDPASRGILPIYKAHPTQPTSFITEKTGSQTDSTKTILLGDFSLTVSSFGNGANRISLPRVTTVGMVMTATVEHTAGGSQEAGKRDHHHRGQHRAAGQAAEQWPFASDALPVLLNNSLRSARS